MGSYKCAFHGNGKTIETAANRTTPNLVKCDTPVHNELPSFPIGAGKSLLWCLAMFQSVSSMLIDVWRLSHTLNIKFMKMSKVLSYSINSVFVLQTTSQWDYRWLSWNLTSFQLTLHSLTVRFTPGNCLLYPRSNICVLYLKGGSRQSIGGWEDRSKFKAEISRLQDLNISKKKKPIKIPFKTAICYWQSFS